MWDTARLSVFMSRNSNGSVKEKPFFWTPEKGEIEIRGMTSEIDDMDHGRAMVSIDDPDNPEKSIVIVLFSDKIVIQGKDGPLKVIRNDELS